MILGFLAVVAIGSGILVMSSGKTDEASPSDKVQTADTAPAPIPSAAPPEPPSRPARTESAPRPRETPAGKSAVHPPSDENAPVTKSHETPAPPHPAPRAAPPRPAPPPPKPPAPSRPSGAIVRDVPF
ncbi:MAG TPA: hypothetical protein VK550_26835 [Polyangiaceae bacterium]|nr:hypothetical protein [Polyangiaceae bacterium]